MIVTDIIMAFLVAVDLELFSFANKYFKWGAIFVSCFTLLMIYFFTDYSLEFAGNLELSVWLMLVIAFDIILMFVEEIFKKHIKR